MKDANMVNQMRIPFALYYKKSYTWLLLIGMIILSSCTSNENRAEEILAGTWIRLDGTYRIHILEVKPKGELVARYFNPEPINISRASWRFEEDILKVFIEFQDVNYPGSRYHLTYNEKTGRLDATYYQAVDKINYDNLHFIKEQDK
ncbi:MAG: hypothetical protein K8R53_08185 [Bacteroidales bacterium]|nr:hypothetical protein [Bacteroidales bacterium]